jgi:hypothetical protein
VNSRRASSLWFSACELPVYENHGVVLDSANCSLPFRAGRLARFRAQQIARLVKEASMLVLAQPPVVFAAIGYSLLYLLLGGGLGGAVLIFIVAKMLGK